MFRNRIALRLTLYFAAALIVFSLIIGSVFMVLFRNHTVALQKMELEKRATAIAQTMSGFMSGSDNSAGYSDYLRFIDDIAMADVWIIDDNFNLISWGQESHASYSYTDLPQDADSVIKRVFAGDTAFSETFSSLLKTPTLTVGTPIKSDSGTVIGVVLLHSSVEGTNAAVRQGYIILAVSLAAALLISLLLSVLFSLSFTRPLSRMQSTALDLAEGDYSARTDVKQDDEIGRLAATMDTMAERIREASQQSARLEQLRRDFVANISHELRTPVTVIRGSLEALCDGIVTEPAQVKAYHGQMLREAIFLQRLVGDLLDLSTLQNADFVIEMQEISLCDLLEDVMRSASQLAQRQNAKLEVQLAGKPCTIAGDYGRLRQMLMIVLDNAIKFSPSNGLVAVTYRNGCLSVKDSGPGIAEQDLPYIFDRFYKSRSEQNKTGTGLGLAIARQIADRHGIRLTARNNAGEGAEFRFEFPAPSACV